MGHLSISLLGTIQVTRDGQALSGQAYAKVLALLAYLMVESDRPHTRAILAGLLWPDQSEERARHSLRQALSTLRHLIEDETAPTPFLLVSRDAVQFDRLSDYDLDVQQFVDRIHACDRHEHSSVESCAPCAQRYEQAIELYRGDFLAGFGLEDSAEFEDWIQIWRNRLHQNMIQATSTLASYHEQRGANEQAAAALTKQLELEPWQEQAHRRLMGLLWSMGNRTEAIAQFERCRKVLEDELGVEPDQETLELLEAIRSPTSSARRVHALANRPSVITQLPAAPGRLVGRERDLEEIADILARQDCRLLTLVGPGGVGKTRLAIQVASQIANQGSTNVCFVELASVLDARGVASAIAANLGLTLLGNVDPEQQVREWLRDRTMFLVLDNLEQLGTDLSFLSTIMEAAPGVSVLATSRVRLNLRGEWIYQVDGLDVPTNAGTDRYEGYGSVELFGERLRQVRPRVPLQHEERSSVIHICQLVGGMPLAIELAAGWAQTLTIAQIEAELRKSVDFLATSLRDVPERHRSMRAVFDQTWQMLGDDERAIYSRLSVFRDGLTLNAAGAVADISAAQLAALVNASLLTQLSSGRFRLHELLRQFAAESLEGDARTQLHDRHSAHFLESLAAREEALTNEGQHAALNDLEADMRNIQAAWNWAIEHGHLKVLDASMQALWHFYVIRGWMREGADAFGAVLKGSGSLAEVVGPDLHRVVARAQVRYGGFLSGLGQYDEGIEELKQGLAVLRLDGDPNEIGLTLNMIAAALKMKGEVRRAKMILEESLQQFEVVGNEWGIAFSMNDVGLMSHLLGETEEAAQSCGMAQAMFRKLGDRRGDAFATYNLGMIAASSGDHQRARKLYQESLARRQDSHDQWGIAASLVQLATESQVLGRSSEARTLYLKAVKIAWDASVTPMVLEALVGLTALMMEEGESAKAHDWLEIIAGHPAITGQLLEQVAELRGEPGAEVGAGQNRWAVEAVNNLVHEMVA